MLKTFPVHASVAAIDLNRARSWYADKLGLTPDIEDAQGLWYRFADGTWLHLTKPSSPAPPRTPSRAGA